MKINLALLGLACASLLLSLAVPAGASGKETNGFSTEFTLKATNGSLISVEAENGKVQLTVSHGRLSQKNFTFTTYKAPASVSRRRIKAHLGALGEISVGFEPSGKVRITHQGKPKGCKGPRKIVRRLGTFTGTIRFEGEEGYASIETDHVNGSAGTPTVGCFTGSFVEGGHEDKHHHRPKGAYLGVTNTGNTLGFAVTRAGAGRRSDFVAQSAEKAGSVSIMR